MLYIKLRAYMLVQTDKHVVLWEITVQYKAEFYFLFLQVSSFVPARGLEWFFFERWRHAGCVHVWATAREHVGQPEKGEHVHTFLFSSAQRTIMGWPNMLQFKKHTINGRYSKIYVRWVLVNVPVCYVRCSISIKFEYC